MPLPNLANELLLLIAENLSSSDLNSLLQANHRLATLLTPLLHTLALQDKNNVPALCWAAIGGYEPLVQVILDSGADVNAQDKRSFWERKFATVKERAIDSGETALHLAIGYKHEAVMLLLEREADMTLRDGSGKTPILRAAATSMEMFLLLVKYGADISPSDNNGLTALHLATSYRHSTLVKYLLDNGVEIDIQEDLGQTLLHIATTFTHNTCEKSYKEAFEIVRMLLEGGANVNACDNNHLSQAATGIWGRR